MVYSKITKYDMSDMLKRIYIGILLVIFGGIVLHAPLSVGFGTIFPNFDLLIKSWKEILMLIAGLIAIFLLYKNRRMKLLQDPILVAIGVYAAIHLMLLALFWQGLSSSFAGLAIDLRYVLFFGLVYIAMRLYPSYRKLFIRVGIAGALVVLVFALLQVFILPYDVLKYIGYNKETIIPYLVVDRNYDFIRINSTLRGPNPLGAYAGMVLVLVVAAFSRQKIKKEKWPLVIAAVLSVGGAIALSASYSRSALVGTIVAIVIVLAFTNRHRLSPNIWVIGSVILFALIGGFLMARNTYFVSNVFLHENPNSASVSNSNKDHINSLKNGFDKLVYQPLGAGVGSTGSASLYGNKPIIIENQYLFIAHEVGWLGLLLFVSIFIAILWKLWDYRKNWLALGVFASGIGLALVGLLLPVWVDDTVSIVWWGLAAVVVGGKLYVVDDKAKKKIQEDI
jgi:hypothetical protein